MTTDALSGDRERSAFADPSPEPPAEPSPRDGGPGARPARDAGLHPRPTSRRGRAAARRRVPTSSAHATAAGGDVRPGLQPRSGDAGAAAPSRAGQPRRRGPRNVRRRRAVLLAGIGVLTAAGTVLAVVGLSQVRTSTAGRYEEAVAPTEPGYQAYVVPTPTMGVLHRGADGTLAGAAILALESGDDGGSVIVVPPATIVTGPDSASTIADVYRDEGAEAAAGALGVAVAVGVADHVEVDDAQWAQLVAPVGPVEVTLDTAVGDWPAGPVTLDPSEVGPFLTARDPGETDLDRVERQELFWNAWLSLVGEEGETALPGEVGSGVGRFVLGVARGGGSAAELPVRRAAAGGTVRFRADGDRLGEFVSLTVPYPLSATPGGRVRVRLLNGTGDAGLSATAARALVASGAQISIVGNATSFDVAETSFVYFGEDRAPLAEWLRTNLGGGRVAETPNGQDGQVSSDDEIDVTVILGDDAEDLIGEVEEP